MVIFNHMAFPMKLDVMGALVSELLPNYPRLSTYRGVQQSLKRAQEGRNMVVHGRWAVDDTSGEVQVSRLSARGKLKASTTPFSVAEIRAVSDLIVKASQELFFLVAKAGTTNSPPHSGQ